MAVLVGLYVIIAATSGYQPRGPAGYWFCLSQGTGTLMVTEDSKNFYANKIEHYFLKLLTAPFPRKRETIVCTAYMRQHNA